MVQTTLKEENIECQSITSAAKKEDVRKSMKIFLKNRPTQEELVDKHIIQDEVFGGGAPHFYDRYARRSRRICATIARKVAVINTHPLLLV